MKSTWFVSVALFLAGSHAALADVSSPDVKLAALPDADAGSATTGSGSKVSIEAGEDGAKVKLRVASDAISLSGSNYLRFSFGAEAPFDSDSQESADLGTLSGLSSGTKATLEASWLFWDKPPPGEIAEARKVCEAQLAKLIPNFKWEDTARPPLSITLFTSRMCHEDLFTEAEIDSITTKLQAAVEEINNYNAKLGAAVAEARKSGTRPSDPEMKAAVEKALTTGVPAPIAPPAKIDGLKKQASEARVAIARATNNAIDPVRFITLGVSANHDDFSYVLESAPTEKLASDETGHAASISFTEVRGSWLWNVGYSREKTFESGKQTEICSPIGTTGSLSCAKAVIGAPEETDTDLAFGEIRWMLLGGKYAMSPRVEYDANESEWGFRLPIYLAKNSSNELTAGIALGYTTKDDDFGISLFVGKAFDFFD